MDDKNGLIGIILLYVVFIFTNEASSSIPNIEKCVFENAEFVVCSWKTSEVYSNLRLFYRDYTREDCFFQCQPTKSANNLNLEFHCSIENKIVHKKHVLFLAPIEACSTIDSTACWNCSNDVGEEKIFESSITSSVLTHPPMNLEFESNYSILRWSFPKILDTSLEYILENSHVIYKLEYRRISCSKNTSKEPNLDLEWKIWYQGNQTSFSPSNLTPGCWYQSRVFNALLKPEQDTIPWSNSSKTIQFLVVGRNHNPGSGVPADKTTIKPTTSQTETFGTFIALSVIFLFVFIFFAIFRKQCSKVFPSKIKVPKPMIMIPLTDLQDEQNFFNISDLKNEEKPSSIQPLLLSFLKTVESTKALNMNQAKVGDDKDSTQKECSGTKERRNSDETEFPTNSESSNLLKPRNSTSDQPNLSSELQGPTNNFCTAETFLETSPNMMRNKLFDSSASYNYCECSTKAKLRRKCDENQNQFEQVFFPPQYRRSFLDYVGYVKDPQKTVDNSSPSCSIKSPHRRSNPRPALSFHETLSPHRADSVDRCRHRNIFSDSNTSGFSSLPSVSGDYVLEMYSAVSNSNSSPYNPSTSQAGPFCSRCKKQVLLQTLSKKQTRKSLGEIPNDVFERLNSKPVRSRHEDTVSLDSGCNLDLSISPT